MVVAVVIALSVLLIAVPVIMEMRAMLTHGHRGSHGVVDDGTLPLLIFPAAAHAAPAARPRNTPVAPAPVAPAPPSPVPPPPAQPERDAHVTAPATASPPPHTVSSPASEKSNARPAKQPSHRVQIPPARPVRTPGPAPTAAPVAARMASAPTATPAAFAAPRSVATRADRARDREYDPGATVVFRRPVDEPVQILPGRFKVISGEKGRDEIRFVGSLGKPAQIIVGRDVGPPQRVVTLTSPTVSRQHARMDFANGSWSISNLSATNPVLVNNERLSSGGARTLADGDQIELGEVILRFHTR